ncbi:nuclear transport factor 2 family protein [Frankia gtarii]|uniref:nuclear transport factor 2 family protein n=1 Tax=Frankia gtarii TaxID=2950102 RepID=UPI0021BF8BDA|nr:nuclear transport factor 2 family protein [Frankia gtarii]
MTAGPVERTDVRVGEGVPSGFPGQAVTAIDTLISAWRTVDSAVRKQILDKCVASDVYYSNPFGQAQGIAAFSALIGEVVTRFPGYHLVRTTGIDLHHQSACFQWSLRHASGHEALQGVDFLAIHEDHRIASISAFFAPAPAIVYNYRASE